MPGFPLTHAKVAVAGPCGRESALWPFLEIPGRATADTCARRGGSSSSAWACRTEISGQPIPPTAKWHASKRRRNIPGSTSRPRGLGTPGLLLAFASEQGACRKPPLVATVLVVLVVLVVLGHGSTRLILTDPRSRQGLTGTHRPRTRRWHGASREAWQGAPGPCCQERPSCPYATCLFSRWMREWVGGWWVMWRVGWGRQTADRAPVFTHTPAVTL